MVQSGSGDNALRPALRSPGGGSKPPPEREPPQQMLGSGSLSGVLGLPDLPGNLQAFGNVPLCVNLADVGRGMAENDLGAFQAKLFADLSGLCVTQPVRGPTVDAGLVTSAVDRTAVGSGGVLCARLLLGLPLFQPRLVLDGW